MDEIEMRSTELKKYRILYGDDEGEKEAKTKENELKEMILAHTFSKDEIMKLVCVLIEEENRYFNPYYHRISDLLCDVIKNSEHTNEDGKLVIEIDDEVYSNFYASATRNQTDGWDRALWIDIEDGRMWTTCETKNTTIENLKNTIFCVESVHGDNNLGVSSVCMDCCGCIEAYCVDKKIEESEIHSIFNDLYYKRNMSDEEIENFMHEHNITRDELNNYFEEDTYFSWYNNQFDDCVMEYAEINEHEYRFIEFERI